MGATRVPVITNPGSDPGRNQPKPGDTGPEDARSGNYRDPQSMVHNPGGAATTRKMWASEAQETAQGRNGPAPRDRGNRAV
jgi:hypothetical protein